MSSEESPLLSSTCVHVRHSQSAPLCCTPLLSKRCRTECAFTKAGFYLLIALAIVNGAGFSPFYYTITSPGFFQVVGIFFLSERAFFMLALLMFPVAGIVGEVCCKRFKMLLLGSILIIMGWSMLFPLIVLWTKKVSRRHHGILTTPANCTGVWYIYFKPMLCSMVLTS